MAAPPNARRRGVRPSSDVVIGGAVAILGAVVVLLATRRDPMMSPDSVTYLATAQHIRHLHGIEDLTGLPLTVFPPVFPLLLTPGGAALGWARVVLAASLGVAAWCLVAVVRRRAGLAAGLVAGVALALSPGLIRVSATVWSEAPYVAISAATLAVLCRTPLNRWWAAAGGLLAALGFLTRYAGAGLVAAAAVVVLAATAGRPHPWRVRSWFAGGVAAPIALWVLRNVVLTGQPLGPRFEGGSTNSLGDLADLVARALGELLGGRRATLDQRRQIGWLVVILIGLAGAATLVAVARRWRRTTRALPLTGIADLGMAAYAAGCVVLPVVARMATSNDIEFRVMSPTVLPLVYGAVVALRRGTARWAGAAGPLAFAVAAGLLGAAWVRAGVAEVDRFPATLGASLDNRAQFSEALYDAVAALPADAVVMTNNPHRVWWFDRREPTYFGFTRPRPGNSVYPRSLADTVALACRPEAYLAWFVRPGDPPSDPRTTRPDLAAVVHLDPVLEVPNGLLLRMSADPARCPVTR